MFQNGVDNAIECWLKKRCDDVTSGLLSALLHIQKRDLNELYIPRKCQYAGANGFRPVIVPLGPKLYITRLIRPVEFMFCCFVKYFGHI